MGLARVPAGADRAAGAGRPWSDRAGRKLLYLYGFVLFSAASAACGLAPSLGVLIALRVVQAAGAALLQANSVALVVTSVPARTRRAALGIQAAAQAVGLACGPVVGGVLVATVGWRWVFLINVPVGLLAVVAGWYLLPRTRRARAGARPAVASPQPVAARRGGRGADLGGIGLLAASTSAGMLAISSLSGLGLPAWAVAACLAVAVTAGAALARHSRRAAAPLLDLRALAGRRRPGPRRRALRLPGSVRAAGALPAGDLPPGAAAPRRPACC